MSKIFSKNTLIFILFASNVALALALFRPSTGSNTPSKKTVPVAKVILPSAVLKEDSRIQACFEAYLMGSPDVTEGIVHMNWVLNEAGQIQTLKLINSDMKDEQFTGCLLETVRSTRFPASAERAGLLISHKFKFRPKTLETVEFQ